MNKPMIEYDYISEGIKQGYANTKIDGIGQIGWKEFEQRIYNKKLFLFGCGNGLAYYMYYYHSRWSIEAIVDNDSHKVGTPIKSIMWEFCSVNVRNKRIQSPDIFTKDKPQDIAVIVTSLKHYEEITLQLKRLGIDNVAALILMEAINIQRDRPELWEELNIEAQMAREVVNGTSICSNRIVFFMELFTDHGRYITNKLIERGVYDICWIVKRYVKSLDPVKQILISDKGACIEALETARVIVASIHLPEYFFKRRQQIYFQVKHWGSITLKKFYLDVEHFNTLSNARKAWQEDAKKMDYIITGSNFDTQTCRSGFGYSGKFLESGSCRSDAMFASRSCRDKIIKDLDIAPESKILLYSPTYRWNGEGISRKAQMETPDFLKIKKMFLSRGEEVKILLRMHPGVADLKNDIKLEEYMLDVSLYYDGQALVSASDIMITDYSSIMFEMAYVKKPVFLFAPDYQEYTKNEYDFLIDYQSLPFSIAQNTDELIEAMRNFDQSDYERKVTDFLDSYGVHEDGHASERTADFIVSLLEVARCAQ